MLRNSYSMGGSAVHEIAQEVGSKEHYRWYHKHQRYCLPVLYNNYRTGGAFDVPMQNTSSMAIVLTRGKTDPCVCIILCSHSCSWLKNLNEYGLCLLTNIPTNSWQIKTVREPIDVQLLHHPESPLLGQ